MVTGAARGLGFEFCKAFLQSYGIIHRPSSLPNHISPSGCSSMILLDLKESECNEAVNELTAFAVGKK